MKSKLLLSSIILSLSFSLFSETKAVVTKEIGVADGYTLFIPLATQETIEITRINLEPGFYAISLEDNYGYSIGNNKILIH